VLDTEEARLEIARRPHSFLRVTKAEAELPSGAGPYDEAVYAKARDNLRLYQDQGLLLQDAAPCFYIYRQKMGGHEQAGVVAAASVGEYCAGKIKKHELTRPDKENDRVNHIKYLAAQTGPVFLAHQPSAAIDGLLAQLMAGLAPDCAFTSEDGIFHSLYVVREKGAIEKLQAAFASLGGLYIADGHHRSAAAARVAAMAQKNNPRHSGQEEYNYFLAVIFPANKLQILPYNRAVRDLQAYTAAGFLAKVGGDFHLDKLPARQAPQARHSFAMYLPGCWYGLAAKKTLFQEVGPVASLDVSILQDHILGPLLGIKEPRTDKRVQFVGGIRGLAELEKLVDTGQSAVAFALYPTSMQELTAIADENKLMPPKSTWFEPKLRDALAIHLIEGEFLGVP
jgi:uncharacterized protein (DUF1015 family)